VSEEGGKGANVGDILVGTFGIIFGLCMTLTGGVCAAMWVTLLFPADPSYGAGLLGVVMLLVALGVAALGIFAIYHAVRKARGRYRDR
jgi:hypothetical protein